MTTCPFESRVLAGGPDRPQDDVAAHVAGCVSCQDSLRIRRLLHGEAAALMAHATVPSAASILWKARLRRGAHQADRSLRPIRWVEGCVVLLALAGIGLIGTSTGVPDARANIVLLVVALTAILVSLAWWRAVRQWRRSQR